MGFYLFECETSVPHKTSYGLSVAMLRKNACGVCPLNNQAGVRHQGMKPTGAEHPDLYILGDSPTRKDDREDGHFVGALGEILRMRIPPKWDPRIRWNYIVRTMTPQERLPSDIEIECCRLSIIADIEKTKPKVILGLGQLVLRWMVGEGGTSALNLEPKHTRIAAWTGHDAPVKIGSHVCRFISTYHPRDIEAMRRFEPSNARQHGSDPEFKFDRDIQRALRLVSKEAPAVHSPERALEGVEFVTGHKEGDLGRVLKWIKKCATEQTVGLDYETKKLRPYSKGAKLLTAALAIRDGSLAFPFDHPGAGWREEERKILKREWRLFLLRSTCRKVSHNLAFELEWSGHEFGLEVLDNETWEDTMVQAYVLDERPDSLALEVLCSQQFGVNVKNQFKFDKDHMDKEPVESVLRYNGCDAKYHRLLFLRQRNALIADGLTKIYVGHLVRPFAACMTTMKGVPVSHKVVERNFAAYEEERTQAAKQIMALPIARDFAGKRKDPKKGPLQPSNNNDVIEALQIAGVILEKTKNKKRKPGGGENFSATEEALLKVVASNEKGCGPFASAVLKYRKVSKLITTYVLPVRRSNTTVDGREYVTHLYPDGMLHPVVSTTRTVTTRTASDDPNIQNWPKRGPSKVIRRQVAVSDDYVIVAIDYSGIQSRNVAMESKDKKLVASYWDNYDIHSEWLERIRKRLGKDWRPPILKGKELKPDKLQDELRGFVKNKFVFPSFFGAIGKSIAKYLSCDVSHGEALNEEFFDEFREIKKWHDKLKADYKRDGYVTGFSGYRRRAPIEINQLINAPIQADETAIVCGAWHRLCKTQDDDCIPSMMIHDDLTFIWRRKQLYPMLDKVLPIMLEQVNEWERIVPMGVDVLTGSNWEQLESIGKFESVRGGKGYKEITKNGGSQNWDLKIGQHGVVGERLLDAEGKKKYDRVV